MKLYGYKIPDYEVLSYEETRKEFGFQKMQKKFQKLVDGKINSVTLKGDFAKFDVMRQDKDRYVVYVTGDLKKIMDHFEMPHSRYSDYITASDVEDFTDKLTCSIGVTIGYVGTRCKQEWKEIKSGWLKS